MNIQNKLLEIDTCCVDRNDYHDLLRKCTMMKECAASVYVYDKMKEKGIQPNNETYQILDPLHRKDLIESNQLHVPITKMRTLQPKRRIHKIMKGYTTKNNYSKALEHKQTVIDFLNKHPDIKHNPKRHWVAKQISKNCNLDVRTVRYIVTHLKRIRFIEYSQKNSIPVVNTTIKPLDRHTVFGGGNTKNNSILPSIKPTSQTRTQSMFHTQKINLPLDKSQYIPACTKTLDSQKLPSIHQHIKKRTFGKSNIQNFFSD